MEPERTIIIPNVNKLQQKPTISTVAQLLAIEATHWKAYGDRRVGQNGELFITLQRPITETQKQLMNDKGIAWKNCLVLPSSLWSRDKPPSKMDSYCGPNISIYDRDQLLNTADLVSEEEEEEDDRLQRIKSLRDAVGHDAVRKERLKVRLETTTKGFFGDDMETYCPGLLRLAQINARGAQLQGSDNGVIVGMEQILEYLTAMKISVAGISEVQCPGKGQVGELKNLAANMDSKWRLELKPRQEDRQLFYGQMASKQTRPT